MRVNHRLLYAGVFLVAIGGVLVAADLGGLDTAVLTDAMRLWPLAVVAIGLALVLRKTELNLPTLVLAAALPGLVLGSAFAVGPRFAGDCGTGDVVPSAATTQGTFDGPATVSVRSGCGSLNVTTTSGGGWQLVAANTAGHMPAVDSTTRSLSIGETGERHQAFLGAGRDTWDLALPTTDLDRLSLIVTAGHGQIGLPGARIREFALTVNAAEVVVDATGASVADLSAVINVGSLSIALPAAGDLTGALRIGAGDLRICAPTGLGLRVTSKGVGDGITVNDLELDSPEWQSPNYTSATHHADLTVSSTFGAVEIDPIGGCL